MQKYERRSSYIKVCEKINIWNFVISILVLFQRFAAVWAELASRDNIAAAGRAGLIGQRSSTEVAEPASRSAYRLAVGTNQRRCLWVFRGWWNSLRNIRSILADFLRDILTHHFRRHGLRAMGSLLTRSKT